MDRNFYRSLQLVLKWEGGYANHPNDPGGPTNMGITLATFRRFVKPNGSVSDLKQLTVQQAGIVYRRQYWDACLCSELPAGIDYSVFDFAVTSGPSRAVKYLQALVKVPQDGRVGPVTLAAVRKYHSKALIRLYFAERLAFYKRCTHKGKRLWPTFGDGWKNRLDDALPNALNMASLPVDEVAPRPVDPDTDMRPAPQPEPQPNNPNTLAALIVAAILAVWGWWESIFESLKGLLGG